jgi:hypothetical protein
MVIPILIALAAAAPQAPAAGALTFTPPQKVVTLDKIKGEPIEIAWSADGTQIYLEAGNRTRVGTFEDRHHYVLTLANAKVKGVDAPPQWATEYQTWKSNKWAPGDPSYAIAINEENRTQHTVSTPMGGDLAKGGGNPDGGSTANDVLNAALTSQKQHVISLKLKGEVVGEYVDTQFVPGYTFGWAPQAFGTAIAYARPDGHLSVMDVKGEKKEVPDARHALLPAWSDDGSRIAFVQRDGKKFDLYVTEVK